MFCNHKYSKVEGNYQYCTKCGKAIAAPKVECNHSWEEYGVYEKHSGTTGYLTGYIIVNKCNKCRTFEKFEISVYK
jgi:hypothetical protein